MEKQARVDIGNIKVTVSAEDNKCPAVSSDFLEHSQNSLSSGEPEPDKEEANVSSSDRDGQCWRRPVNSENFLQTRGWRRNVQKTHRRSKIQSLCALASPANIRGIR